MLRPRGAPCRALSIERHKGRSTTAQEGALVWKKPGKAGHWVLWVSVCPAFCHVLIKAIRSLSEGQTQPGARAAASTSSPRVTPSRTGRRMSLEECEVSNCFHPPWLGHYGVEPFSLSLPLFAHLSNNTMPALRAFVGI